MATPNLALPEVTANQNNKETTINSALSKADLAVTDFISVDLTSGNATVSSTDFRENILFRTTGLTASGRTITVPQVKRAFLIDNTDGTEAVGIVRGTTTVNVSAGTTSILYTDGTANGLRRISVTGAGSGANNFTELGDAPTSYDGQAGSVLVVNGTEDGLEFRAGVGQVGSMGPWRFLQSYTLSGTSVQMENLGGSSVRAIMVVILGARVNTDDSCLSIRFKVGGSYQNGAGSYAFTNSSASQGGASGITGTTATSLHLQRDVTAWRVGSDTDEDFNGNLYLFDPHATVLHRVFHESSFENLNGNNIWNVGGGVWTGGTGAIEGIELSTVGGTATFSGGTAIVLGLVGEEVKAPLDISAFAPGEPTASQTVLRYVFTRDVEFPANFAGSFADAGVAAAAQADFDILLNGVSIGTMTFDAAADTASFTVSGGATAEPGDVLSITAPGTPDDDLADISITLSGAVEFV